MCVWKSWVTRSRTMSVDFSIRFKFAGSLIRAFPINRRSLFGSDSSDNFSNEKNIDVVFRTIFCSIFKCIWNAAVIEEIISVNWWLIVFAFSMEKKSRIIEKIFLCRTSTSYRLLLIISISSLLNRIPRIIISNRKQSYSGNDSFDDHKREILLRFDQTDSRSVS